MAAHSRHRGSAKLQLALAVSVVVVAVAALICGRVHLPLQVQKALPWVVLTSTSTSTTQTLYAGMTSLLVERAAGETGVSTVGWASSGCDECAQIASDMLWWWSAGLVSLACSLYPQSRRALDQDRDVHRTLSVVLASVSTLCFAASLDTYRSSRLPQALLATFTLPDQHTDMEAGPASQAAAGAVWLSALLAVVHALVPAARPTDAVQAVLPFTQPARPLQPLLPPHYEGATPKMVLPRRPSVSKFMTSPPLAPSAPTSAFAPSSPTLQPAKPTRHTGRRARRTTDTTATTANDEPGGADMGEQHDQGDDDWWPKWLPKPKFPRMEIPEMGPWPEMPGMHPEPRLIPIPIPVDPYPYPPPQRQGNGGYGPGGYGNW